MVNLFQRTIVTVWTDVKLNLTENWICVDKWHHFSTRTS